ncbi:hypothetical protein ONS95_013193 [Cadophora gregata]|uniref:uncharacterized protein n=1 Tax=Cadophora gregata TaxID=51156 RepID=UPI0026DDC1A7|nr:uncharacterized protein ONS95_013193 [Cadophora gregata]KAK0099989.1 hypothetical protein ONS96_007932 [Cadophora gregata f. sp. sojae]KAK0116163.1 hypothetical protein ONS95_013193 [Cadophora gregata]
MTKNSNESHHKEVSIGIELGDLTPQGRVRAAAIHGAAIQLPPPRLAETEKKSLARRKCIDPMKRFCEKRPRLSLIIFIAIVSFWLLASIVLLTLFMGLFKDPDMTDGMRDEIEHLPGYNTGTYL